MRSALDTLRRLFGVASSRIREHLASARGHQVALVIATWIAPSCIATPAQLRALARGLETTQTALESVPGYKGTAGVVALGLAGLNAWRAYRGGRRAGDRNGPPADLLEQEERRRSERRPNRRRRRELAAAA